MKNYYEILEVARNASPEVIEKAYKTLIKKYHPDLQPEDKKKDAENMVKLINEAYDVLSNDEKKLEYDNELKNFEYRQQQARENALKSKYQNSSNSTVTNTQPKDNQNLYNKKNINQINAEKKAYFDAYNAAYAELLKSMGYKVKYKRTFKETIKYVFSIILTIVFLVIISYILWHIPFIKNKLIEFYNNNNFVKIFVDLLHNIFINFINLFK